MENNTQLSLEMPDPNTPKPDAAQTETADQAPQSVARMGRPSPEVKTSDQPQRVTRASRPTPELQVSPPDPAAGIPELRPAPPVLRREYFKNEGMKSLAMATFLKLPNYLALEHINAGGLADFNERDQEGMPLPFSFYQGDGKGSIPSCGSSALPNWPQWLALRAQGFGPVAAAVKNIDPSSVHYNSRSVDVAHVLAALIYSGANPWLKCGRNASKSNNTELPSCLLEAGATGVLELCLTHPKCPKPSALDALNIPGGRFNQAGSHNGSGVGTGGWLHHASRYGNFEIIDLLLSHGMNVDVRCSMGRTPLFYARKPETVEKLINAGASLTVRDNDGLSLIEFWNQRVDSATALSELFAPAVAKMRSALPIAEQQQLTFAAVLDKITENGTIAAVETLYKSARFTADFRFQSEQGVPWNFLMPAVLSGNENLVAFFTKRRLDWSLKPFSASDVSIEDVARLLSVTTPDRPDDEKPSVENCLERSLVAAEKMALLDPFKTLDAISRVLTEAFGGKKDEKLTWPLDASPMPIEKARIEIRAAAISHHAQIVGVLTKIMDAGAAHLAARIKINQQQQAYDFDNQMLAILSKITTTASLMTELRSASMADTGAAALSAVAAADLALSALKGKNRINQIQGNLIPILMNEIESSQKNFTPAAHVIPIIRGSTTLHRAQDILFLWETADMSDADTAAPAALTPPPRHMPRM